MEGRTILKDTTNTQEQLLNHNTVLDEKHQVSLRYLIMKRIMDVFGSLIGILITIPIAAILWIAYQFGENRGPLFFKQKRIGKDGKVFYIYKFRSMIVNAEGRLKENEVLYKQYRQNNYKLEQEQDPRVTKLGRILRKTSIDEFPQFFNVIKGELSIVGPRPVVEEELNEYKNYKTLFLSVKPGITGYWQTRGRSDIGYPERVYIELDYVRNQCLSLDIKIIFSTVLQVLKRKGAY